MIGKLRMLEASSDTVQNRSRSASEEILKEI